MGCELELEEWGYASEIKQILNKIKAAPCEMQEKQQVVVAGRGRVENEVNTNNTTKGNGAGRTFQTSRTG